MFYGGGEFKENTQITIEAKANEGYIFVSWSDGNTDNPRKVVVTANASYTAMFKPLGATISFNGESWTAQSFICDNITGNYLPISLYKTAGDQNDVYLRGSMMKTPGSYTYETSDGDFFSYLDPTQTWTFSPTANPAPTTISGKSIKTLSWRLWKRWTSTPKPSLPPGLKTPSILRISLPTTTPLPPSTLSPAR